MGKSNKGAGAGKGKGLGKGNTKGKKGKKSGGKTLPPMYCEEYVYLQTCAAESCGRTCKWRHFLDDGCTPIPYPDAPPKVPWIQDEVTRRGEWCESWNSFFRDDGSRKDQFGIGNWLAPQAAVKGGNVTNNNQKATGSNTITTHADPKAKAPTKRKPRTKLKKADSILGLIEEESEEEPVDMVIDKEPETQISKKEANRNEVAKEWCEQAQQAIRTQSRNMYTDIPPTVKKQLKDLRKTNAPAKERGALIATAIGCINVRVGLRIREYMTEPQPPILSENEEVDENLKERWVVNPQATESISKRGIVIAHRDDMEVLQYLAVAMEGDPNIRTAVCNIAEMYEPNESVKSTHEKLFPPKCEEEAENETEVSGENKNTDTSKSNEQNAGDKLADVQGFLQNALNTLAQQAQKIQEEQKGHCEKLLVGKHREMMARQGVPPGLARMPEKEKRNLLNRLNGNGKWVYKNGKLVWESAHEGEGAGSGESDDEDDEGQEDVDEKTEEGEHTDLGVSPRNGNGTPEPTPPGNGGCPSPNNAGATSEFGAANINTNANESNLLLNPTPKAEEKYGNGVEPKVDNKLKGVLSSAPRDGVAPNVSTGTPEAAKLELNSGAKPSGAVKTSNVEERLNNEIGHILSTDNGGLIDIGKILKEAGCETRKGNPNGAEGDEMTGAASSVSKLRNRFEIFGEDPPNSQETLFSQSAQSAQSAKTNKPTKSVQPKGEKSAKGAKVKTNVPAKAALPTGLGGLDDINDFNDINNFFKQSICTRAAKSSDEPFGLSDVSEEGRGPFKQALEHLVQNIVVPTKEVMSVTKLKPDYDSLIQYWNLKSKFKQVSGMKRAEIETKRLFDEITGLMHNDEIAGAINKNEWLVNILRMKNSQQLIKTLASACEVKNEGICTFTTKGAGDSMKAGFSEYTMRAIRLIMIVKAHYDLIGKRMMKNEENTRSRPRDRVRR